MLHRVHIVWRRQRPYFVAGLLLIIAFASTWQLRRSAVQTVRSAESEWQSQTAGEALEAVDSDFGRIQRRLERQARALATDSLLPNVLRTGAASRERPSRLLQRVKSVRLDDRSGIEVYDASASLLAWNGTSMPLATLQNGPLPSAPTSAIVADRDVRQGLVVWWPVERDGTLLGAVRAVRILRFQPPVQNRYIQGYDIESEWRQATGEFVEVVFGRQASEAADAAADPGEERRVSSSDVSLTSLTLTGIHGEPLAEVTVRSPSGDQLVATQAKPYDDLLAFWGSLLGGWLVAGLWLYYLRAVPSRNPRATADWFGPAAARFGLLMLAWIGLRYGLVVLDVPSRWVPASSNLASLFDPTHLASTLGWGALQSTGDLLVTALFALGSAAIFLHLASRIRPQVATVNDLVDEFNETEPADPRPGRFFLSISAASVLILGLSLGLAEVVRRAVLDSTLDYFSRTGIFPETLVLIVLCSLFIVAVASVLTATGIAWVTMYVAFRHRPSGWPRGLTTLGVAVVILGVFAACFLWPVTRDVVPLPVAVTFVSVVSIFATLGVAWGGPSMSRLTLRSLLPSVLALTMLLYPMLYSGMDMQRHDRMMGAALSFEEGRDPRVLFSIEQVLNAARRTLAPPAPESSASARAGRMVQASTTFVDADSTAQRLVQRSLLASLTTYEASLVLVDSLGRPLKRFRASGVRARRTAPDAADTDMFEELKALYALRGSGEPLVEQLVGRDQRRGEPVYGGLVPLGDRPDASVWVMVRAEPRSLLPGAGTGVPAVLLPDGSYSDLYAELSLAEFRDGTLTRSLGRDFGRVRLPDALRTSVEETPTQWRQETVRGNRYLTLYRHRSASEDVSTSVEAVEDRTVAVRIPAVLAFDHLYYILRLTIAGLCVTFVLYLLGIYVRYRQGQLPTPSVRFRDKVLTAFLAVGVVSMIAVGVVGVQVVTGENTRVIERRLHDHLNRVEETLALEAQSGEMMYRVAERVDLDSLAARVGLDLRMYEDGRLRATSRARLVRDRLVEDRLPIGVYQALYDETYRFTTAPSYIGSFQYVVGYQALPSETGAPQYVLAVPTLAQQERIEEEQARTLAYLFGALLILVVVVMLTALLLANALARPIAQLREGLEAVGEGRYARELPVETRDEIGDLVRTFNEMREQLRESRRKLAQQERELAWREMARQVAHEIKNPLTPMKLSIQHLRRAYQREEGGGPSGFGPLFDRITETLIEQIEALARIANEFSTFARLPTRVVEPLDLNEVIQEAARLMQEDADGVQIETDLSDGPLVVEADREELRRIFINLIKNAIQAIPDHRDGNVVLSTTPVTGSGDAAPGVRCTIEDNGTGIPTHLQDRIFQPKFSTKTSGTGLGLAIARKGIEELNGQIGFSTVEGERTTFWIHLPLSEQAAVEA
jgi:two-component system, NtrC family, nitrogen regulation sensor histidine kinase NtrY